MILRPVIVQLQTCKMSCRNALYDNTKKERGGKDTVGMYFLLGQLMRECACDQRMPQFKQLTEVNCQNIQAVQNRNTDQTCRFQHLNITI